MAAFREGISTVLIPRDNASDLYEVDAEVKEKVRFIPVGTLSEVLKHALVRPGRTPARAVRGVPQATSLIANDKPAEGPHPPAGRWRASTPTATPVGADSISARTTPCRACRGRRPRRPAIHSTPKT